MVANVVATNGAKVYIGPAAATTVDTLVEYEALTFVQINGVNQMGTFGDAANVIEFDVIDESRTRKAKGTFNAGSMQLVMALDDNDAGQEDLLDALEDERSFAFKVEFNDKLTDAGTNTMKYFRAKVASAAIDMGGSNDVIRRNVQIAIDSAIITDPAT